MAFERMNDDLNIISRLGDIPGSDDGLTPQELKARFDKAALLLQAFINDSLIPQIENQNVGLPVGGGTMQGPINMNGQPIIGLNTPTSTDEAVNMGYVNQQVKKSSPYNLLDNSDFRNPVNQRGLKTYEGSGYGIDRWAASGSNYSVTVSDSGYVVFTSTSDANQTIRQFIPDEINLYGKTVTLACETTSGTVYCATGVVPDSRPASTVYRCVCNIGNAQVRLCVSATMHNAVQIYTPNYTVRLRWIALYEGEYTPDTLPKYQPKGYAHELRECRRYFRRIVLNGYIGTAFTPGDDLVRIEHNLGEAMRVAPSIKVVGGTVSLFKDGSNVAANLVPSSFYVADQNNNLGQFQITNIPNTQAPTMTVYAAYAYNLAIDMDANLS